MFKSILLLAILLVAFWIRIHGRDTVPEGHFTGVDAYIYYFQAQQIAEQGRLPVRDMHRWLPIGRDNRQLLSLYSYALAYSHKTVVRAFPNITLYDVAFYMPVFCFCVGLGGLCLFLAHTFGIISASFVGVLLATLPGAINRSTAGFGDRDAWCWMLGLLAVITYLIALQAETPRKRLVWTLASGFIVFLGGMSWEGFGVFLSVILVVEVWRFLTSRGRKQLRSLSVVADLLCSNALSGISGLSEWVWFCGTSFCLYDRAPYCASGYPNTPTSSPHLSGKIPTSCPHTRPRFDVDKCCGGNWLCFDATWDLCRNDRAFESKRRYAKRW